MRLYGLDIGMTFGMGKFAMLIMRSRKRYITEGIKLLIQEIFTMLGTKKTYKYLGILEVDTIKQAEKETFFNKIPQENQEPTGNQTT